VRGGVRSLSVAYSVQCDDLGDDFPVEFSWRKWSLPMGTYSHSQRSQVHWASGKLGTLLPEYSTPNCVNAVAHAFRPGRMRTPRNNPNLCEFLSARSARAICDGFLCIGALIPIKQAVRYVRSCPIADKMLRRRECPLSAISGLMHRSNKYLYSITSSASASNFGGIPHPCEPIGSFQMSS